MKMLLLILSTTLLSPLVAGSAPVYSAESGSFYEIVYTPLTWDGAKVAAESYSHLGLAGRLATITSAAENNFLSSLIPPDVAPYNLFWLGGLQQYGGYEPAERWTWMTGETWDFTSWAGGEPNNAAGGEDFLAIYGPSSSFGGGKWNDVRNDQVAYISGYIIEYAPVPEPSAVALCFLFGLALFRRCRS